MQVAMKQIMETAPHITHILPHANPGVNHLLQRALAKEPAERFGTTAALAQALASVAGGQAGGR